ncbi:hypothetical protein G5B35_11290 [Parapusillimonas sp. SGNA-6]|nr:hypothetical protein [Parapusillimonas sp. SGNA-6]
MNRTSPSVAAQGAQEGQALVLGMLIAGVAIIVFVRYFLVGQVVAAKARQVHALDAVAYSGALIQARALNMLAYTNRAHVGHQVAMAHLVTLGSWASMGGTQSRQLSRGDPPPHLISMMFGEHHGAAYRAASKAAGLDQLAGTHAELARAYASHDHVVHDVLASVQEAIVSTLPAVRLAAMQAVLARNYVDHPQAGAFQLSVDYDHWPGYVQRYSPQRDLHAFTAKVAQRYGFLADRNHTEVNAWLVDGQCPAARHQLRRRGTTEFDAYGRWQSTDTQSFHALRSNRWIGCYFREYAMGWGWIPSPLSPRLPGAHVDDPPADFSAQDFWRWVQESTDWDIFTGSDNPLANSRAAASRPQWAGRGLPAYFDTADDRNHEALGFGLTLQGPGPDGVTVSTHSAAQTFFVRPQPRRDARLERSNLFHPYWQARLVAHHAKSAFSGNRP